MDFELLVGSVKQEMCQLGKALWPELAKAAGNTGYRQRGIAYLAGSAPGDGFLRGMAR